jgi:hypothetical protein
VRPPCFPGRSPPLVRGSRQARNPIFTGISKHPQADEPLMDDQALPADTRLVIAQKSRSAAAWSNKARAKTTKAKSAGARVRLFRGRAGETGGGQATHPDEDPRHRRRNLQSAEAVECPWNLEQRAPGFGDGLRRLPALTNRSRGVRRTKFPFGIRSFNSFRFLGRNRAASY